MEPVPQPEQGVTHAPRIEKSEGVIDWQRSAAEIDRRIRAFDPWPGSSTWLRDRPLKVLEALPLAGDGGSGAAGEIAAVGAEGIDVCCGDGSLLRLRRVQRPGRRGMAAADLINGERLEVGERLTSSEPNREAS